VERGVGRAVRVFPTLGAATSALARHLRGEAVRSVRERGRFTWVLSGGRTPERLYRHLARAYRTRFPWRETEVYFGDERCVGPRNPESNYRMARQALLAHVPLARGRVHRLEGEVRPASRAAARYARAVGPLGAGRTSRTPRFDSVLLGLGPDGHTASLFPDSPALRERHRAVVPVLRSGQPPYVPRLTLTLPALASAREVVFLVAGREKADAVARTFSAIGEPSLHLPASLLRPWGSAVWYLDRAAASGLSAAQVRSA
jgi:6-phosphogluconolactonase